MKILLAIPLALSLCNMAYANTTQPVKRLFTPAENGCQTIETFFKFTNEFKGDELVQYVIAKNFNIETSMPISRWGRDQGTVSLPHGDSITYKNTYDSEQSIISGTVIYSSSNKKIYRPACGVTFYYDENENSCGSVIILTGGGNCRPTGGNGTEADPYVFMVMQPQ